MSDPTSPSVPAAVLATCLEDGQTQDSPPLSRRMFCMVYEAVLLFGVVFIADYLFDTLTQSRSGLMYRHPRQAWLFVALGIYFTWFWTHSGQTLAMKTWHIRLVTGAGAPVGTLRAALRYVLCWMFLIPALALLEWFAVPSWMMAIGTGLAFFLPPLWMLVDRDHQFVHDRLAGTRLVSQH